MAWMELSLDTTHEAVDWVRTLLAETHELNDVRVTEYTQPNLAYQVEPDSAQPPWTFTIRFYIHHNASTEAQVEKIVTLLLPLHRTGLATTLQMSVIEEKPTGAEIPNLVHRIGQRFVVLTPDAPYQTKTADEITLRLKTSLSFGSGLHPATIVSLKLLERYIVPNMNVLDLGSGSGILSVAMAKLGAKVLALDNDSIAVEATQDAVHRNGVDQRVSVKEGSLGQGNDLGHWMGGDAIDNLPTVETTTAFDLIVTNILARVHIALANDFQRVLRRTDTYRGLLITSGFTADYEKEVDIALTKAGLKAVDCERLNEWVALAHRVVWCDRFSL